MKLEERDMDLEISRPGHEDTDGRGRLQWQQAQQRVLRYLNALQLDPLLSLDIARRTLTMAEGGSDRQHPVAASMQALRRILSERRPAECRAEDPFCLSIGPAGNPPAACGLRGFGGVMVPGATQQILPVMPPVNRSRMLTEHRE